MQNLVEQYRDEHDVPALEIAAALAKMSIGDKPLLLAPEKERPARDSREDGLSASPTTTAQRDNHATGLPELDSDKERYRIEVGHEHDVKPGNIVGAIANEAGLAGEHIGHISIEQELQSGGSARRHAARHFHGSEEGSCLRQTDEDYASVIGNESGKSGAVKAAAKTEWQTA